MIAVFADASYWIALFSPTDALHERAVGLSPYAAERGVISTEMVLTEVLNYHAREARE